MKNFIIIALCALCVWLASRGCGRQTDRIIEKRDTTVVVRIDTVVYTNVQWRTSERVRVDTLRLAVGSISTGDTTVVGDSVSVPIPIDRHVFTDDTSYRAVVSGYRVSLDRMDVFRRSTDRVITIDRVVVPAPKRFGLGLQVGYGICLDGKAQPYVGIGLSYNFIRF